VVVNYTLTSTGSPLWTRSPRRTSRAARHRTRRVVQSAPLIQPSQASFTSFAGQGEISGSFTEASAKNLALAMEFGSLSRAPRTTHDPDSLADAGHSALVAGLGAGLVGLALVLLYTILYYRALGLVIVLGLSVTAALLWAIISALGHTAFAPSFRLGWCHRIELCQLYHCRQLHRVLRAIKGRGPRGSIGAFVG